MEKQLQIPRVENALYTFKEQGDQYYRFHYDTELDKIS